MIERELLYLSAKSIGLYVCSDLEYLGLKEWGDEIWVKEDKHGEYRAWNPLRDDGDAFRLLAAMAGKHSFRFIGGVSFPNKTIFEIELSRNIIRKAETFLTGDDIAGRMRRVIVLAAASVSPRASEGTMP